MIIGNSFLKVLMESQQGLFEIISKLDNSNYTKHIYRGKGIVFIPKGVKKPPLLCSHLDTINTAFGVDKLDFKDIEIKGDKISLNPKSKKQCLGGDDRCGVYIMLELLKLNKPFAFAFFCDEEVGCLGSTALAPEIAKLDLSCYIGLDRKEFNQMALYGYDNDALIDFFVDRGYTIERGSITDASNLARANDLACVNLSIGYYNEHTQDEYILFSATQRTLEVLKDLPKGALSGVEYKAEYSFFNKPYYRKVDEDGFYIYNDVLYDTYGYPLEGGLDDDYSLDNSFFYDENSSGYNSKMI